MNLSSPTQHIAWLIELAEMKKKQSQFGTVHTVLADLERELNSSEGELDDQLFCEVAFYLGKSYQELGYVGKAVEYFEQASLFAPEISEIEEKALIREIHLKGFLKDSKDLEPSYIYLKSFDKGDDFSFLCALGYAELALGLVKEAHRNFEMAFNLLSATKEEKKSLFFALVEQELFFGHDFSKIIQLSDLTLFDTLNAYEQTLVFVLSKDMQALQILGHAWFARMNPAESLRASYLMSHLDGFKLSWAYQPFFFQNLSQFDFSSQVGWRSFFENSILKSKHTIRSA